MYNCKLQEAVITVSPTSRFGLDHDVAHVETFFLTDSPIPETEIFLIPHRELIPPEILQVLRLGKVNLLPIPKSEVLQNISDFPSEVAGAKRDEAIADAALGIAALYMQPISLKAEVQNQQGSLYRLSYDFTLYPDTNGNFYIYTKLPLPGFTMVQGGHIRFITVLPSGAQYDPNETKGIALNNQVLEEQFANLVNGQIIGFFWQNDPEFTIKYRY